jgi:hypothetical protein
VPCLPGQPKGYTWSYLACRTGHLVPAFQDNHPARIGDLDARPRRPRTDRSVSAAPPILLSSKTGLPVDGRATRALDRETGAASAQSDGAAADRQTGPRPAAPRRKDETPEEKRARKAGIKEAKVTFVGTAHGCIGNTQCRCNAFHHTMH